MALKDQLEAAGYDTSGLDEAGLLQKLDAAGYDTSTLKGAQTLQPDQPSRAHKILTGVAKSLPLVGGIGGSFLEPGGGTIAGAAAGAGVKEAMLSALHEKHTDLIPGMEEQDPSLLKTTGRVGEEAGLAALFEGAGKALKFGKNVAMAPGAAEVAQAGKEKIAEMAARGAEKLGLANTVKEAAKKGLIGAEEEAGLHFQSTPGFEEFIKDPKKMADFTEKISRLAEQGPQQLAQTVPSEQLQLFRKIAQEGEKVSTLSDIAKSQLRNGKDVFTQALGETEKPIGEALSKFRDASKVVEDIPGETKDAIAKLKLRNAGNVVDAKKLENYRKLIKAGLAGAGTYFGLSHIKDILK